MNKQLLINGLTGLMLFGVLLAAQAVEVTSLRGDNGIDHDSVAPKVKTYFKDHEPLDRDYLQQPPLIPHTIDNYQVDLRYNKCLSCHSWKNHKRHRATKISQTHFESRDGAILSNVSARRYFCTQCHVPQTDTRPLIENEFQPVDSMKIN